MHMSEGTFSYVAVPTDIISLFMDHLTSPHTYCAFGIFQKVHFCLAFYTEEVNLQTFVII